MIQMVRRIFNLLLYGAAISVDTRPTALDGAAAAPVTITANAAGWTFGAWVQIAAAAVVTAEEWLIGLELSNFTGAVAAAEIEIGTGGGGAEVARVRVPAAAGYIPLPNIRIPNATRIAARYRTANAAADTCDVKLARLVGA